MAIIREIVTALEIFENPVLARFFASPYNPKKDNMTTVAISNSPLKIDDK